jgi:hypothetical protein
MVAANKGVNPGWLVPLSAGLCYVGKAGCFMPRGRISRLTFHRTGGGSATFDVSIKLAAAAGAAAAATLELGQIDAAELPKLQAYCADQRIRVRMRLAWLPAGELRGVLKGCACRVAGHGKQAFPSPREVLLSAVLPGARRLEATTTTTTRVLQLLVLVVVLVPALRLVLVVLLPLLLLMRTTTTRTTTKTSPPPPSGGARAARARQQQQQQQPAAAARKTRVKGVAGEAGREGAVWMCWLTVCQRCCHVEAC